MKKAISRKNMKRTIRYTFLMSYFIIYSLPALASDRWQELWSGLKHATYIQTGSGKTVIYDFFDPNCIYCAKAFQLERPFVDKGQLTVRYVPVGFLTDSSFGKAAAILQAQNPREAMENNYMELLRTGHAATSSATATEATHSALRQNERIFINTGATTLPELVYRLPDGQVAVFRGELSKAQLDLLTSGHRPGN
ncbi:MAG: thioredoxin fold domain-containing protein [Acidithiobacillus ferrooxidans]|nr:thioredoxin fold domain-containing protein [Acidithiobacillus ferrooxidans]MDD5004284.1 thioredoxin fold domain-containing protein [Acidithiobacillus sp.]MDD5378393.1 thioredoxin fold domain-containing protein [Acidithiobacillus sp.]MDD5576025.1 thioredoxin fold domain-containing protein [Acidithiobacillus sp.]